MIAISLGEGRTLTMAGGAGKCYELYFDMRGNPVAFRVKVLEGNVEPLGYAWIMHRRSGARVPKGWLKNSKVEEHDAVNFQSKVIALMHIAAAS